MQVKILLAILSRIGDRHSVEISKQLLSPREDNKVQCRVPCRIYDEINDRTFDLAYLHCLAVGLYGME